MRGWPFPRRILSLFFLSLSLPPLASGLVHRSPPRYRTQVLAHPNNVRPLARSGQCLASPARSPAGSPPHPPSGPIELGRVRSSVLGTLAACFSPPPLKVEVKYRGPRMGWSKAGTGQTSISNQVQVRTWESSQPVPSKTPPSRSPSCAGPRSNQGPIFSPQSLILQAPRAWRNVNRQASKQAVACVCMRLGGRACRSTV